MGHDIIAGNLSSEQIADIRKALQRTFYPDIASFHARLDHCHPENFVATLRRSAYDPYNQLLYKILDAEHMYAGVSGIGEVLEFTRVDIRAALDKLEDNVVAELPPLNTSKIDKMYEQLKKVASESTSSKPQPSPVAKPDIEEERAFLCDILIWMTEKATEEIRIYFG